MGIVERLNALLPSETAEKLTACGDRLTQIRMRAGRPVQLVGDGVQALCDTALEAETLQNVLAALMEYSVYARQEELDRGFFTLEDGSRVGVCGRMYLDGMRSRMGEIGSACIRVAREAPGCAEVLLKAIVDEDGVCSTLIASPPGLGKTTLLRDVARGLSAMGRCVGVADERHELAACRRGVPTLDVGERTDVMDGCPRSEAIGWMLRSMSPEVIVADEIGGEADARALSDAARCGVAVIASAHAASLDDLYVRAALKGVMDSGVLRRVALLGPKPGQLKQLWRRDVGEGGSAWRRA